MLERGGEVNVVLPSEVERFLADSVTFVPRGLGAAVPRSPAHPHTRLTTVSQKQVGDRRAGLRVRQPVHLRPGRHPRLATGRGTGAAGGVGRPARRRPRRHRRHRRPLARPRRARDGHRPVRPCSAATARTWPPGVPPVPALATAADRPAHAGGGAAVADRHRPGFASPHAPGDALCRPGEFQQALRVGGAAVRPACHGAGRRPCRPLRRTGRSSATVGATASTSSSPAPPTPACSPWRCTR